jgi:cytochrome P450
MTPVAMKKYLSNLKVLEYYDVSRPTRKTGVKDVTGYALVNEVLKKDDIFAKPYAAQAAKVIPGKGFYTVEGAEAQAKVHKAIVDSPETLEQTGTFFFETTRELITSSSFSLVGKKTFGVDIVRDVIKIVPLFWAATEIAGITLKTKVHPQGQYTPIELYNILGDIYSYIFLKVEPSKTMLLGAKVSTDVKNLLSCINEHVREEVVNKRVSVVGKLEVLFSKPKKAEHTDLVKRLSALGGSSNELANRVLAILVSTVELSLALTNVVHVLFGSQQHATLQGLAKAESKSSLDGFIHEALRLDPPFQGVYRTALKSQELRGLSITEGERIFVDIAEANRDETFFKAPLDIDPARGTKETLQGDWLFAHLGEELTVKIIGEVLRAIYTCDNVRLAPGNSGTLSRFKDASRPDLRYAYPDSAQFSSPWPTSLSVLYDVAAEK